MKYENETVRDCHKKKKKTANNVITNFALRGSYVTQGLEIKEVISPGNYEQTGVEKYCAVTSSIVHNIFPNNTCMISMIVSLFSVKCVKLVLFKFII